MDHWIPVKMCIRYLGFLLLIWLPGIIHGQSVAQSCSAPNLEGGFFSPKLEIYPHGAQLTYTCNDGHVPVVRGWWAASSCQNGKWTHEPQCIESLHACSAPPKIPHAVIIDQGYQDVFAADSELQYECQDGYAVEGVNTNKSIICLSGMWSKGPVCIEASRANVGRDESTVGGAGGGHTASAGRGRQPTGGGSSTTSDRNSGPFISIKHCGAEPAVQNGDVVERADTYLKYKCGIYYKLVGSDTVVCHSDRTWSTSPTCEESYCRIDPAQFAGTYINVPGSGFMEEGKKRVPCIWPRNYYSWFECTNRRLSFTRCCYEDDIRRETCPWIQRSG